MEIKNIINKYNIKTDNTFFYRDNKCNTIVQGVIIYKNNQKIGTISVRTDTFEIVESIRDDEIKPAIIFMEEIMKKCGSAESASNWLEIVGRSY